MIQTYEINFTGTANKVGLPSGSFTFDSADNTFSNFIVDFGGQAVDFTATANEAPTIYGCSGSVFDIMAGSTTCVTQQIWIFGYTTAYPNWFFYAATDSLGQSPGIVLGVNPSPLPQGVDGSGFFSITPAPEPADIVLCAMAVTILALRSRRHIWKAD